MGNTITLTMPDNVPTYLLWKLAIECGLQLKHDGPNKKSLVGLASRKSQPRRMSFNGSLPGSTFTPLRSV